MSVYDVLRNQTNNRQSILDGVCLSIASILRRLNRNYNDYELRGMAGEWTAEEVRAEILASFANEEKNRREDVAWSGIWHGD